MLSEEEKKAIEWIKCQKGIYYKTIVDLIKKQDKIINEMAKYIDDTQMECNVYYKDKEEVIEYFEKKVEEN